MQNPRFMNSKSSFRRMASFFMVFGVVGHLLVSCGGVRPDPQRFERTKQTVLAAQAEGLSDAAPVEMRFIQQKLAAAELAFQHGDAGQADALLREIEIDLETARLRARVNQLNRSVEEAKMRNANAQRQLMELQEALNEQ